MDETNSELEEMDTVESRDEAYERTKKTMSIDEFMYEYEYDRNEFMYECEYDEYEYD